jgi:Uma2 family endonuclease
MMPKTLLKIGPKDHGKRMSLEDFEHAEVQEGYLYELGRGVVVVTDVPNPPHLMALVAVKRQLSAYDLANPGRICALAAGSDCKVLIRDLASERHPDLAVYKTPPPADDSSAWEGWIPELVIEVVSPSSGHRDYDEKPDEYLLVGIREYWVVDPLQQEIVVFRRHRGRATRRVLRPPEMYRTRVLPGFELDCDQVFAPPKR